jgi:hypothetical protein
LLQQHERTDDVGLDERGWPIDGAINVAFRGQMHDDVGPKAGQKVANCFSVGDIGSNKAVVWMIFRGR